MQRWILLGLSLVCFIIVFTTKSAFALGVGLLVGSVATVGFILSLAAERISSVSRPDTAMAAPEQLLVMSAQRAAAKPAAQPAAQNPQAQISAPERSAAIRRED